jgi:hypothetical protein
MAHFDCRQLKTYAPRQCSNLQQQLFYVNLGHPRARRNRRIHPELDETWETLRRSLPTATSASDERRRATFPSCLRTTPRTQTTGLAICPAVIAHKSAASHRHGGVNQYHLYIIMEIVSTAFGYGKVVARSKIRV